MRWVGRALVGLVCGIGLIGVGGGGSCAARRRCVGLISSALNLPVERRKGFSGRHDVGCMGCQHPSGSCLLWSVADTPETARVLCGLTCAGAASCNRSPWADSCSSERRNRCGDPFASIGRACSWLVRCAADTAGRGTAWNAPRRHGNAGVATEDGLGRGDSCRRGDRRERRALCDAVASVAATFGG